MTHCLRRSAEGHAVLELALVIPVLVLVCFAALAASAGVSDRHTAATLSRELGSYAFRLCAEDNAAAAYDRAVRGADPSLCLAQAENQFRQQFLNAIPAQTGFALTLYTVASSGAVVQEGQFINGQYAVTRVSAASFSSTSSPLGRALQDFEMIVVAEAFVPYSYTNILPSSWAAIPRTIYAASFI